METQSLGRDRALRAGLFLPFALVVAVTVGCGSRANDLKQSLSTEPKPAQPPQYTVGDHTQWWGELRVDTSVEGRPLTLGGKVYPNGLGTHAASRTTIAFPAKFNIFAGACGVDDEVGTNGSVAFKIMNGKKVLFESKLLRGGDGPVPFAVLVKGLSSLTLVVEAPAGDPSFGHADWVNLDMS